MNTLAITAPPFVVPTKQGYEPRRSLRSRCFHLHRTLWAGWPLQKTLGLPATVAISPDGKPDRGRSFRGNEPAPDERLTRGPFTRPPRVVWLLILRIRSAGPERQENPTPHEFAAERAVSQPRSWRRTTLLPPPQTRAHSGAIDL